MTVKARMMAQKDHRDRDLWYGQWPVRLGNETQDQSINISNIYLNYADRKLLFPLLRKRNQFCSSNVYLYANGRVMLKKEVPIRSPRLKNGLGG